MEKAVGLVPSPEIRKTEPFQSTEKVLNEDIAGSSAEMMEANEIAKIPNLMAQIQILRICLLKRAIEKKGKSMKLIS